MLNHDLRPSNHRCACSLLFSILLIYPLVGLKHFQLISWFFPSKISLGRDSWSLHLCVPDINGNSTGPEAMSSVSYFTSPTSSSTTQHSAPHRGGTTKSFLHWTQVKCPLTIIKKKKSPTVLWRQRWWLAEAALAASDSPWWHLFLSTTYWVVIMNAG